MSICRTIFALGFLGCACCLSGCGAASLTSDASPGSGDLLAVKVADYTGADALSAKADVVTEQAGTVSLPAELTQDTVDAAVISLAPADIVVALAGAAAKVRGAIAKGRLSHASIVFRLAEFQDDPCMSDITVGPFELTIEDGTVSVAPTELPIPPEALALFRDGRLALCAETQADFDGTISIGKVAVETGRLHGGEERVTICHMPPGEENDVHTITVGSSAVDAHLAHGDQLGECDESHDGNDPAQDEDQGVVDGEGNSADDGGDDSNAEDQSDLEEGEDVSSDEMDDDAPNDGEQTCTVFTVDGAVEFSDFSNPKTVGVDAFVAGVDTVIIGFDVTTDGDPLVAGTIIDSVFHAVGVRLAAVLTNGPHAGEFTDTQALDSGQAPNLLSQVGISPPNILSGVDPDLGPQFSGGVAGLATLIVTFVTPSGDPAKVSQVGAFNDLIFGNNTLTAYAGPDASGRVLGTVSATDPGDFFGLGSSAGIASVTFSGYSTEIDDLTFTPVFVDCNDNGASDRCDVANGTSPDNDDDGIPDECQDSDADGDGIDNASDACASTPQGETADAEGCSCSQKDADADSVDDCTDTCAATGAGLSVDANGCASNQLDDDGDGVMNDADACANTAAGVTVDAYGCSCAQRGDCDTDGDGVYDQDDLCPGTPAGNEIYADGCTVITLSAFAGPDRDTLPGDIIDAVGQGSVLTGDYDPATLVYTWEQVGGDPVWFEFSSPSLTIDTEGSSSTATFRLAVSTADGSASATDEFTVNVNLNAVTLESAVCNPATGHCYARIDTLTWCSKMKAAANNMYYNGMRGHLATITTSTERSFLATVARNAPGIIAGTDRFEEGTWVWDDGPEEGQLIEWLPWASENEPNNLYHWSYPEGEDYISNLARGWDDLNGWRRYYVEFELGW